MIKAIIFDFGGVFSIDDDIVDFWKKNAKKLNVNFDKIVQKTLDIWFLARVGKIDSNIFWEELGKEVKMTAEEFKKYFLDFSGFRVELLEYVKNNLYGNYKLAILSNQIESWLEPILEEKKFYDFFDVIITSYNTGFAKPDKNIYIKAVDALDIKTEECLYIDDRPNNLEPAKLLGMKVIEFENFDKFIFYLNNILQK